MIFELIITDLCAMIAHHAARNRALAPLVLVLWGRLKRLVRRLDSLMARWKSGRLQPPRPRLPRPARAPNPAPPLRLPTGDAWLIRLILPTGAFTGQLRVLLATDEMQALLAEAPQAGRIFRPLCRMLGLELPEQLRLPRRVRKPRPAKPRVPRPTGHRSSSPPRLRLRVPGLRTSTV